MRKWTGIDEMQKKKVEKLHVGQLPHEITEDFSKSF